MNLNPHLHCLVVDGVWIERNARPQFIEVGAPTDDEVRETVQNIAQRVLRYLMRRGYFSLDENLFNWDEDLFGETEPVFSACVAASIRYKIALGERAKANVRRIGSMAKCLYEDAELSDERCAQIGGFSLHANVGIKANERKKLERLCRYISRPPLAVERLTQRADGLLLYRLKKPYHDGTEFLMFSEMEFMEKLAALVPRPRVNLTRFHGVFAPHSRLRSSIVPKPRDKNGQQHGDHEESDPPKNHKMSWAILLKRVFNHDISICPHCGGELKVISAILDSDIIEKILSHLGLPWPPPTISPARSPPQQEMQW